PRAQPFMSSHDRGAVNADRAHASTLMKMRRWEDAIVALNRVVAAEPHDFRSHGNLASCLEQLERFAEALKQVEIALELAPEFAWAHKMRGTILARRGQFSEAAYSFREAVRIAPDWAEAYQAFNFLMPRTEFHAEVLAAAREAVRLSPNDPWAWFSLGRAERDLRESEAAYGKCLELNPELEIAHNNRGWQLL